jgi:hypothetical protein
MTTIAAAGASSPRRSPGLWVLLVAVLICVIMAAFR